MKRIGGHEDTDNIGDIVGAKRIGPECPGQDERGAGIGINAYKVKPGIPARQLEQPEKANGDNGRQDRTQKPGQDDFGKRYRIGRIAGKNVPADNGADNRLAGGYRQPCLYHGINRHGGSQRCHEGPGKGRYGPQFSKSTRCARAGYDRAKDNKNRADDRRRAPAYHAGADRRAKHIGRIIGAKRPAQEQAARQIKKSQRFHDRSGHPLDGIDCKPVGNIFSLVGNVVDLLGNLAQVQLAGKVKIAVKNGCLQAG